LSSALQSIFTFLFKYPPRVFQRGDLVMAPVVPALALTTGLVAAVVLAWLAARGLKEMRPADRVVLGGLRIAVFALVAGCLLRPALALTGAVPQRNVLAIALDDSRSMRIRDVDTSRRVTMVQRVFADSAALVKRLADKFALRFFSFSADASPIRDAAELSAAIDQLGQLQDATNPGRSDELQAAIVGGLKDFKFNVWRKFNGDAVSKPALGAAAQVPPQYRAMVEEYYRALARKGPK
jgi:hypothetical protein